MKTENALVLGTFDGLHPGHRAVIESAEPYRIVAVTFRIPPKFYFGDNSGLVMLPEDKLRALKLLGADEIKVLDFEKVRNISPEEFLKQLVEEFSPARICCGYDYRFGINASGDTGLLSAFCRERNIEFVCSSCVSCDGVPISSTLLRGMLVDGDIEKANSYIYGGFGFTGAVLHGDARGRTIGFPTLNQKYPELLAPLKPGVYSAEVETENGIYRGISNIGIRPTFQTKSVFAETHLLGFSDDVYGKIITLKPKKFLRPEKKFNSVEELKKAISDDISALGE